MRVIVLTLALIAAGATAASAACPAGTRYQCFPSVNGKMQCGCY